MSINKVFLSGNLTRDAELRKTPSGNAVCNVGMAVNDRKRNSQGEWEDYANFVELVLWGRRAEAICQYLTKGTKVCIEGRIHYAQWEDRNGGGKRSKIDVNVDEIEFMSGKREGSRESVKGAVESNFPGSSYYDEDIPAQGSCNDEDIPFSYGHIR